MNINSEVYQVAIIDYGLGNLHSIKNICDEVGLSSVITNDRQIIKSSKAIILPGVGSFPMAMKNLAELNLIEEIKYHSNCGKFIWGICLGFQLLFENSNEFGSNKGLSLVEGEVLNLDVEFDVLKPHIGWNICESNSTDSFISSMNGKFYFFNHSFAVLDVNYPSIVKTKYNNVIFVSAIRKNHIIGTQFHPEKSGKNGILLFKKFKELIEVNL